jgi:lipoprotein-releasing system permease protein
LGLGTVKITNPFLDSDHLPLAYTYVHYFLAGMVALVSSVAAGYAPARKAAHGNPVEIIRGAT